MKRYLRSGPKKLLGMTRPEVFKPALHSGVGGETGNGALFDGGITFQEEEVESRDV